MTDHQQVREALEPCPFCGGAAISHDLGRDEGLWVACGTPGCENHENWFTVPAWNRRAPRLKAAAAAEYERGRQDGMKQEHALWQMQRIGQEIEAADAPELSREDVVRLARECGATTYTNRHYPDGTAVAFGPDALTKFCASLVRSVPVGGNQS